MLDNSHKNLIKTASYLSVLTALIILSAKIYGWFITNSQSMLASLIDSMLDISSSLINLIAVKIALCPPDHNHRFGHEKFQDLAIFSQAIFFFASSLFTMSSAGKALFNHTELANFNAGINIMYLCLILTFCLVCFQTYVIKRTSSKIIEVDKFHYLTDFLTNIVVIISFNLSNKYWFIDPLCAIGISLYIIYASYSFFRQAIRNLADEEFPNADKQKILTIISKHREVKGIHEFKTRYAASKPFIQFHIELDREMSLLEAHEISDRILEDLLKEFPGGEITIHQDPHGVEEGVNYREF